MPRPKAFDEQEALQRAMEVFWKKGYHATSVQDLVDGMGINRASLYDTFGDKHQLFLASLQLYRQLNRWEVTQSTRTGEDVRTTIRLFLQAMVDEALVDTSRRGCFVVNATLERVPADPDTAQIVCENYRALEEAFGALIEEGQRNGEIAVGQSPAALARFVVTLINGLRVMGKTNYAPQALNEVVEVALQALSPARV
ncbi:MAG: TetR/AcrR family transcriptional regulator [Ferruginibacter sp.]|nr:TetR/AcrR family transcriptional regulator [Cytophagales bacterium]